MYDTLVPAEVRAVRLHISPHRAPDGELCRVRLLGSVRDQVDRPKLGRGRDIRFFFFVISVLVDLLRFFLSRIHGRSNR